MNALKKTWVWLCRFRKRKGYGVHSPFAYDFIRTVINERGKYYAYDDLKPLRKTARQLSPVGIDKLLFRLANHFQPHTAVHVGTGGSLSLRYIQAGCKQAHCQGFAEAKEVLSLWKSEGTAQIDMLYISETPLYKELFEAAIPLLGKDSVVVIGTPYESEEKRQWWHAIEADPRTPLTFDLYEAGIVLFKDTYSKQRYKVNFT